MIHELKLNIQFCDDVYNGIKTFEIRFNDRNYQVSDFIKFIPVDDDNNFIYHPIKNNTYKISYLLNGWGLKENYLCLGLAIYG